MAKLVDTKDVWLEGRMSFLLDEDKNTYADFVEYIGCNAAEYEYAEEDMERRYTWIAEEDETGAVLADVDANGNVNVKDATAIQKHIAGMYTGFAIGQPV